MVLTCTRNVRWSQCQALNPGQFLARMENGHFEVQGVSGKGKEEWVKFDIVQQTAISRQAPTPTAQEPASTPTTQAVPASIEPPESTASGTSPDFPKRWKSMPSGTVRVLRFEGDYIYSEVVLPEAAAKAGIFYLMEVKKDGDKYVGKVNGRVARQDGGASCPITTLIELTHVTKERIEGRGFGPAPNAQFDWVTCEYSPGPIWNDFSWIPIK
jgi:hypothetical protein